MTETTASGAPRLRPAHGCERTRAGALGLVLAAALVAGCGGATPGDLAAPTDTETAALAQRAGATLAVSPSPALARQPIHVSGCGYASGVAVSGQDKGPEGVANWSGTVDASGCLSADFPASASVGSHTLSAYQQLKSGRPTLMAKASLTVNQAPLSLVSESYYFRWDPTKGYVGEDDTLDWSAAGYLAPGQSYSFTPRYPDDNDPRAVMVELSAASTDTLQISTVVQASDQLSNVNQSGRTISVTTSGGAATLCMFPNTIYMPPTGYTITITNVGAATAAAVTVTGRDYNDWPIFYWSPCLAADADHDGWSDSYEHTMAQLIYPTGNFNDGALPAGADYLAACGTSQTNDEYDSWPPDLDDDGAVTQADVDLLSAHIGEGNGIPWAQITPNSGPANFWNHVGAWNRFDLNADGIVNSSDLDLLKSLVGKRCGP